MRRPVRSMLTLAVCALFLAACTAGGDDALGKSVSDLRADLQRSLKDNEKLAAQVAAQARRIDGLTEDLNSVRQLAIDGKTAPAGAAAAAGADGGVFTEGPSGGDFAATSGAFLSSPEGVAIKTFLTTDEGRKALLGAVEAEREARDVERAKRGAETMVDRFAKDAGLTEDQTKRMKDVMSRQALAVRGLFGALRDLGPDATPEQRDELRQQNTAKVDELRKSTDTEVKAILDQTQYEKYQQAQDRIRSNVRGGGQGGGNNGRPRGNRANGE